MEDFQTTWVLVGTKLMKDGYMKQEVRLALNVFSFDE